MLTMIWLATSRSCSDEFVPFFLPFLFFSHLAGWIIIIIIIEFLHLNGTGGGKHTREAIDQGSIWRSIHEYSCRMSDNRDYTLVVSECLVMIQQRGQITMTLGARGPRSYHGTRFPGIPGFSGLPSQSHGALQRNRSMRRSVIRLGGRRDGSLETRSFETRPNSREIYI